MPYISESAMQKINLDMISDDERIAALEAAARMVIDDALDYKTTSDPARVTWTSINALRRAMGELPAEGRQ